jgi:aminomethyltransferase
MSATSPRTTSLYPQHLAAGAKLGDFAGWQMPLDYGSPRAEHLAVREGVGMFDVSHMGQIEVSGTGARELLVLALTNRLAAIGPGQGQYTLMLDDAGGVIDDLIVYALIDRYLLVVNAANRSACWERIESLAAGRNVSVADRSDEIAMIAVQGPLWERALGPLVGSPAPLGLDYFEVTEDMVATVPAFVARTGYTGEPGVELMCPWELAPRIWEALLRGQTPATPAGLVARDTLRTEMGYPLYGNELSRARGPIPAGLRWACDVDGLGFAGAASVRHDLEHAPSERLVGVIFDDPGIPRPGQAVLVGDQTVGVVTSGTLSPTLERGIGMAYVAARAAAPDTPIVVDVRGRPRRAHVARRPFVARSPRTD